MNSHFLVITSFSKEGFSIYGDRFLSLFRKHWPTKSCSLVVYTDGMDLPTATGDMQNVEFRRLEDIENWHKFQKQHKDNPPANGWRDGKRHMKWDAIRFSHKTYAVTEGLTKNTIGAETGFWVDADVVTHAPIPEEFLASILGNDDQNVYTAYLGRKGNKVTTYPECGFVAYRLDHPVHNDFMMDWQDLYNYGDLFKLDEWHDSYVYDYVRREYERFGLIKSRNLTLEVGKRTTHPFINSDLGKYMDHLKGPRKQLGKSHKTELVVDHGPGVGYWQ